MIELISAAKVGKKIEIDVSLLEKVVSNQENVRNLSLGSLISINSSYLYPWFLWQLFSLVPLPCPIKIRH